MGNKWTIDDEERKARSDALIGTQWYNNGKVQSLLHEDPHLEGWVKGKLYQKIPKSWKHYNNGKFNTRYFELPGPEWKEGALPRNISIDRPIDEMVRIKDRKYGTEIIEYLIEYKVEQAKQKILDSPDTLYFSYLYLIVFPGNKYYIGQHRYENQNTFDETYLGSGVYVKRYYRKYGKDNLTYYVLEWAKDQDELDNFEALYVSEEVMQDPLCVNFTKGGRHGGTLDKYSEEEKQKIYHKIAVKSAENNKKIYSDPVKSKRIKGVISQKAKKRWENKKFRNETIAKMKSPAALKKKRTSLDKKHGKFYNNGVLQARILNKEDVPKGWVEGRIRDKYPRNWVWYTDGKINIKYRSSSIPLEGFYKLNDEGEISNESN